MCGGCIFEKHSYLVLCIFIGYYELIESLLFLLVKFKIGTYVVLRNKVFHYDVNLPRSLFSFGM